MMSASRLIPGAIRRDSDMSHIVVAGVYTDSSKRVSEGTKGVPKCTKHTLRWLERITTKYQANNFSKVLVKSSSNCLCAKSPTLRYNLPA